VGYREADRAYMSKKRLAERQAKKGVVTIELDEV